MNTTIFGIRHHGPGCARSLRAALKALRPEAVLIEGPPDAEAELPAAIQEGMKPPVALLVHRNDDPRQAVFYPFAEFSPEWQAITWALTEKVAVRFMDFPWGHRFAIQEEARTEAEPDAARIEPEPPPALEEDAGAETAESNEAEEPSAVAKAMRLRADPLSVLAEADGYSDSERWWNDRVEERGDPAGMFVAIREAMIAVRGDLKLPETDEDLQREAWMRRCIRQAEKDGMQNLAVVCGAWHAPALAEKISASADNELLKGLPKCKVTATWVPWTYERLCSVSGYGAGIPSPGWYEHLWKYRHDAALTTHWMARTARVLRAKDLDASSAHVIESVRLADNLAALRGRPLPGLPEMNDAILSIFCHGDLAPLRLVSRQLIVGERMGELPEGLARPPLQQDIEATQKRLRLKPLASIEDITLDLREPLGQERSRFLHRLHALAVPWGEKVEDASGKGTFKEIWQLEWKPEFALAIIDASRYGNTVETAAAAAIVQQSQDQPELDHLSSLLELALFADLPMAVAALLAQLAAEAARGDDVLRLLRAVPPLARLARYGNVRKTDADQVTHILDGFSGRIHAGTPVAGTGIDDEAAAELDQAVRNYHAALDLLESPWREDWHAVLRKLLEAQTTHPLLAGMAARLLYDAGQLPPEETAARLQFALSRGQEPARVAAWIEGFLHGSGLILLHDERLLPLLEEWVTALHDEHFTAVLPLLRRSFSTFTPVERAKIAAQIGRRPGARADKVDEGWDLDETRARMPLPLVTQILGLNH